MERWGNERANAYYEANLPNKTTKPKETDPVRVLEQYIRDKYEKKKYIAKQPPPLKEREPNVSSTSRSVRNERVQSQVKECVNARDLNESFSEKKVTNKMNNQRSVVVSGTVKDTPEATIPNMSNQLTVLSVPRDEYLDRNPSSHVQEVAIFSFSDPFGSSQEISYDDSHPSQGYRKTNKVSLDEVSQAKPSKKNVKINPFQAVKLDSNGFPIVEQPMLQVKAIPCDNQQPQREEGNSSKVLNNESDIIDLNQQVDNKDLNEEIDLLGISSYDLSSSNPTDGNHEPNQQAITFQFPSGSPEGTQSGLENLLSFNLEPDSDLSATPGKSHEDFLLFDDVNPTNGEGPTIPGNSQPSLEKGSNEGTDAPVVLRVDQLQMNNAEKKNLSLGPGKEIYATENQRQSHKQQVHPSQQIDKTSDILSMFDKPVPSHSTMPMENSQGIAGYIPNLHDGVYSAGGQRINSDFDFRAAPPPMNPWNYYPSGNFPPMVGPGPGWLPVRHPPMHHMMYEPTQFHYPVHEIPHPIPEHRSAPISNQPQQQTQLSASKRSSSSSQSDPRPFEPPNADNFHL